MHLHKNTNLSIQSTNTDDDALNLVIDDMYKKHNLCSWTSNELYFMYLTFGGVLTLKQMFNKLKKHLDDDIIVIRMAVFWKKNYEKIGNPRQKGTRRKGFMFVTRSCISRKTQGHDLWHVFSNYPRK